jgi:hypothetical protein
MWMCVSVCEYLVIRCDKTTVHEIIDRCTFIYGKENGNRELGTGFPCTYDNVFS